MSVSKAIVLGLNIAGAVAGLVATIINGKNGETAMKQAVQEEVGRQLSELVANAPYEEA